jgi:outer membrane biosynthesis protein TonB
MDARFCRAYDAGMAAPLNFALARMVPFAVLALACASAPPPQAPSDEAASAPEATTEEAPAPASAEATPSPPPPSEPMEPVAPAPGAPKDTRTKEEIQRVIASNRDKVRACYDSALAKNPGIHGDLVMTLVINPSGSVKTAEVNWAESDLHVPELDACAAEALKTLLFPASSRGLESKVNYPFNFNPPNPNKPTKPAAESSTN